MRKFKPAMKNNVLLLTFVIGLQCISCHEDLLSKFHQKGFKVKDMRGEVIRFNKTIFYNYKMKTYKYNRTTPAHNVTLHPKVNLEDKLEVIVQFYKFLSNEYRHFPIRFQINMQKAFESNVLGFQSIKMCGNMTSFVFHKDVIYYFCNFVADANHLPPLIPNGIYKIEVVILYLNQDVGLLHLYGEIYTPLAYQKI